MIEEAIQSDQAPDDLINVLQQLPKTLSSTSPTVFSAPGGA